MRKYKTATAWAEEVPGVRMIILMSPQGKMVNWHAGTPAPEGKWSLIAIID